MTVAITSFSGQHRWLSNFYFCRLDYDGLQYPSAECAYQAAKSLDPAIRREFTLMRAGEAKHAGRRVALRPDWEQVKLDVMRDVLRAKFAEPTLRILLRTTGDCLLEEGNTWGDRFWGTVDGVGQNHLGRLLMELRAEL